MNIAEIVAQQARTRPSAPAFSRVGKDASYAQVERRVGRLAVYLLAEGVAPGNVVGIAMRTTPLHLVTILALARIGALSIPVYPGQPPQQRTAIVRRFRISRIVTDRAEYGVPKVSTLLLGPRSNSPLAGPAPPAWQPRDPATPWRVVLSSGTTGTLKGVAWTHQRFTEVFALHQSIVPLVPGVRFFCFRGLDSGFGLRYALYTLMAGATVVFGGEPTNEDFPVTVQHSRVTHAVLPPSMVHALVRQLPGGGPHFPGLQHLSVGGGLFNAELAEEAAAKITPNIFNRYGLTEAGLIAVADTALLRRAPGVAGRVVPWVTIEVVDAQDRPLPKGVSGILRFRSAYFPSGYYDDPERSGKVFRDGWLYSGDVGRLDHEGLLHVEGRADHQINLGGMKVDPEEVERVLAAIPGIDDAAAFALRSRDGMLHLCAAVVSSGPIDEGVLMAHCRPQLGLRAPRRIFRVAQLPRNAGGKLVRRHLARLLGFQERPVQAD